MLYVLFHDRPSLQSRVWLSCGAAEVQTSGQHDDGSTGDFLPLTCGLIEMISRDERSAGRQAAERRDLTFWGRGTAGRDRGTELHLSIDTGGRVWAEVWLVSPVVPEAQTRSGGGAGTQGVNEALGWN